MQENWRLNSIPKKNEIIFYIDKTIQMLNSSIEWIKIEFAHSHKEHLRKKEKPKHFIWTGEIIYLIELGYALLETGCINNGDVEIKSFMEFLSECFNIDIKRPSDFYYKMRIRSGSRTIFLDKIKKLLEMRMDRSDEKKDAR